MNSKNNMELLIGTLLIIPLYMVIFVSENVDNFGMIFPIFVYLPIVIGLTLTYYYYGKKTSKVLSFIIIIFIFLSLLHYYTSSIVNNSGNSVLTTLLDAMGTTIICAFDTLLARLFSICLYISLAGKKKGVIFFVIYVLIISIIFYCN